MQSIHLCLPAWVTGCASRAYLTPMLDDAQIVVVWLINWIKLRAMYDRKPFIKWGTAGICIAMTATQFQYLFKGYKPNPDIFGRCSLISNDLVENLHTGGDLAVRFLLSGLFVYSNLQHSSRIKDITMKERLRRILRNDFRASFIDVVALAIKFVIANLDVPQSVTKFVNIFMDFAKMAGTHWFVMDISLGTLKSNGSSFTSSNINTNGVNSNISLQPAKLNSPQGRYAVTYPVYAESALSTTINDYDQR
ncbi:hypothetical protein HK096_010969, partial [Nowakowskiella sp. JEL0078]